MEDPDRLCWRLPGSGSASSLRIQKVTNKTVSLSATTTTAKLRALQQIKKLMKSVLQRRYLNLVYDEDRKYVSDKETLDRFLLCKHYTVHNKYLVDVSKINRAYLMFLQHNKATLSRDFLQIVCF